MDANYYSKRTSSTVCSAPVSCKSHVCKASGETAYNELIKILLKHGHYSKKECCSQTIFLT